RQLLPVVSTPLLQLTLQFIQLADPRQRLMRQSRRLLANIEELPARMRPATDFEDLPAGARVNPVVRAEGIGLQIPGVILEELGRPIALATLRVVEHDVRMLLVPKINPEAAVAYVRQTRNPARSRQR